MMIFKLYNSCVLIEKSYFRIFWNQEISSLLSLNQQALQNIALNSESNDDFFSQHFPKKLISLD